MKTKKEQGQWNLEQIRRCKEGYGGMSGKLYYYFNFWLPHNKGDKRFVSVCNQNNDDHEIDDREPLDREEPDDPVADHDEREWKAAVDKRIE